MPGKDLVEEISSVGFNVTKQTVTYTLRSEGLHKYQTRTVPLLKKNYLKAHKYFSVNMLMKEDSYVDEILCSDETKSELFGNNYNNKA